MTLSELNRAIKESCPFGKTECLMAPGCSAIKVWMESHKSRSWYWKGNFEAGKEKR